MYYISYERNKYPIKIVFVIIPRKNDYMASASKIFIHPGIVFQIRTSCFMKFYGDLGLAIETSRISHLISDNIINL